jgi:hypothetical protein
VRRPTTNEDVDVRFEEPRHIERPTGRATQLTLVEDPKQHWGHELKGSQARVLASKFPACRVALKPGFERDQRRFEDFGEVSGPE